MCTASAARVAPAKKVWRSRSCQHKLLEYQTKGSALEINEADQDILAAKLADELLS
jgi:hypothetical protein